MPRAPNYDITWNKEHETYLQSDNNSIQHTTANKINLE